MLASHLSFFFNHLKDPRIYRYLQKTNLSLKIMLFIHHETDASSGCLISQRNKQIDERPTRFMTVKNAWAGEFFAH